MLRRVLVVAVLLAAVDAATGALLAWNPGAHRTVYAMAVAGGTVYLGGDFTAVGGAARERLAAFSVSSGALDGGWRPSADGPVHALRVGRSQTRVYVGGSFARLDGDPAHGNGGAVDAAGGAIDPGFTARVGFPVRALTSTATSVYAAGDGLGGQLAGWTTAGAAKFPTLQTDGGGQAVAVIGGEVYLGGHFDNLCPAGVRQDPAGRSVCSGRATGRRKLLGVDAATGRPTTWNPTANSALGVFALTPVAGGALAAGGDFTLVGGSAHRRLALFG